MKRVMRRNSLNSVSLLKNTEFFTIEEALRGEVKVLGTLTLQTSQPMSKNKDVYYEGRKYTIVLVIEN